VLSPEPLKLTGSHKGTLQQIFAHPLSHNVEWHAVVALLGQVGSVNELHDGNLELTVGDRTLVVTRPHGKDLDADDVVPLRRLLESLGYKPVED